MLLSLVEKKPYLYTERGSNHEPRASDEDALSTPPPGLGSELHYNNSIEFIGTQKLTIYFWED